MNPLLLIGGIAIGLLALLLLIFFVIAPPAPRVARARRIAPGMEHVSALSRVTQRTTEAIDAASSNRKRRLFGAEESSSLAGIRTEASGFVVIVAAGSGVLALFGAVLGLTSGTSILLALVFALLGPVIARIVVVARTSTRQARFGDQVDDLVQMIAGSLRAGHGLNRAFAAVAAEAEAPASEELARVVNETRLGRPLADALHGIAQRMKSTDFEWVAQAIAINQETGGNLADVLDQVGKTIRDRNQIRRHVKALSAEGRLSAIILVALPVGVFLFLLVLNPSYVTFYFQTVLGWITLVVASILLIIGTIWVSFAVKVKF